MYKLSLDDVFSKDGFNPIEMIKGEEETKSMDSKIKFLSGDKAIKTVTLEMPEEDESTEEGTTDTEEEEELDFQYGNIRR